MSETQEAFSRNSYTWSQCLAVGVLLVTGPLKVSHFMEVRGSLTCWSDPFIRLNTKTNAVDTTVVLIVHFKSHLRLYILAAVCFLKVFTPPLLFLGCYVLSPSYPCNNNNNNEVYFEGYGVSLMLRSRELRCGVVSRSLSCAMIHKRSYSSDAAWLACTVNNNAWQVYIQTQDDVFFKPKYDDQKRLQ
jgi:hypothetical protein